MPQFQRFKWSADHFFMSDIRGLQQIQQVEFMFQQVTACLPAQVGLMQG